MTTSITLRSTKGSALTHDEMDTNLTNLQTTADAAKAATDTLTSNKAEATALGVANTDQNMGSFTGTTIPDNVSAKVGLQSLETAVEAASGSAATKANASAVGISASAANMGTYTGTTIPDNETAKQNIQSLETAVEARPTSATLAATTGAAAIGANDASSGAKYTTVQGFITYLLSSAGSAIAGFIQSGTGAVGRTVQDELRDTVKFAQFSGTDDEKLDRAIAALPATGGTVELPKGTITLSSVHTITKTVRLVGQGFSATAGGVAATQIYKAASMTSAPIVLQGIGSSIENVGLEGIAGNTGDGIQISAGRVTLHNVSVHKMGQDGIRFGDSSSSNCNLFQCRNIHTRENGRHGGYFHDQGAYDAAVGPNVNGGTIVGWDSSTNGGDGVKLYMCWFITMVGFVPQTNTGYGLNVVNDGAAAFLGSRYHTIIGGEQDESNTAGNVNNSGYRCSFLGFTPGSTFTDTGSETQALVRAGNKLSGLTVTSSAMTAENSSGSTIYPIISKNYGNASNGRGAGIEFQVPNGSGTARAGGRIAAEQETTNKDYLAFRVNISGTITELIRLAPNANYLAPIVGDASLDFGAAALRWRNGYIQTLFPGGGTAKWTSGSGTPEGSVTAVVGSLYTRTDGGASTTLYVKESGSGNTGWVAK